MKDNFYFLGVVIMTVIILMQGQFILKPLVLAILLSSSINPLVEWLRKIIRSHAVAFTLVLSLIIAILALISKIIGSQLMALFSDLQSDKFAFTNVKNQLESITSQYGFEFIDINEGLSSSLESVFQGLGGFLGSVITASGDSILTLVLTLIMSYFLSSYYPGIRKQLMNISSDSFSEELKTILQRSPKVVRSYLKGMGTVMVILAIMMSIVYSIIGVEYAIVWGLMTGLLAFIPYVGSGISILLPISYSIVSQGSFDQAILIIIAFSIIQQIEGNFLTPKIVGNDVNMNPLAVIIVMLLAAKLWGLVGVFICIPVAAIIVEIMSLFSSTKNYSMLMSSELKSK